MSNGQGACVPSKWRGRVPGQGCDMTVLLEPSGLQSLIAALQGRTLMDCLVRMHLANNHRGTEMR